MTTALCNLEPVMPINIPSLRLRNQHLLTPTLKDPVDVLKSLVAIQAQDYYGAKWALSQRTVACTDTLVKMRSQPDAFSGYT